MRAKLPIIFLLVAVAFAGNACRKEDRGSVKVLRWVDSADPIADAKAALKRGDHSLRSVYGFTTTIPGTDPIQFEHLKLQYGAVPIEGTSDDLEGEEHHRLVQKSIRYAESYNRYVLTQFKPAISDGGHG